MTKWTWILIGCAVFCVACIVILAVFLFGHGNVGTDLPEFEEDAQAGTLYADVAEPPEDANGNVLPNCIPVPETLGYSIISDEQLPYSVGLCGIPERTEDGLRVYFANPVENDKVWLRLRVLDGEGETILGESGLIRPGEYLAEVLGDFSGVSDVSFRVLGYEAGSYESLGSFTLNTQIG